ncbi:hypothetical protein VCSRO8_3092 [Vibrio cholerae]|nr:hypothetical protein VCSRO8_3092 [Vibrio cholerae]
MKCGYQFCIFINRYSHYFEYPEKEATYQEGFQKLAVTLDKIDAHLQAGELEAAKASLKTVDDLRIEYHDKRNPSIWKRLFG